MPPSAPASVTSRPSRIQVAPRATTISQCHRLHGNPSSREGTYDSIISPSLATGEDSIRGQPSSSLRSLTHDLVGKTLSSHQDFGPNGELFARRYAELKGVDRASAREFARIESEFLDMDHPCVEIMIFFEKRFHQRRRDSASARDGEMRCPGAFLDWKITGQSSFVHTLVQLKE